jgi:hypothetical protein
VIISGKPKLQPRNSGETEESIRNLERQNSAAAGKMDAGTSSQPPTTESDGSFSWTGHAPSIVWRKIKGKNQSDQIREPRRSCMSPFRQNLLTFF